MLYEVITFFQAEFFLLLGLLFAFFIFGTVLDFYDFFPQYHGLPIFLFVCSKGFYNRVNSILLKPCNKKDGFICP